MGDYSEAFVGFDTSKSRNSVAIADGGRGSRSSPSLCISSSARHDKKAARSRAMGGGSEILAQSGDVVDDPKRCER